MPSRITAKERRELNYLRNENAELREQLSRHMRVYSDNLLVLVRYKAALQSLQEAVTDVINDAGIEEPRP